MIQLLTLLGRLNSMHKVRTRAGCLGRWAPHSYYSMMIYGTTWVVYRAKNRLGGVQNRPLKLAPRPKFGVKGGPRRGKCSQEARRATVEGFGTYFGNPGNARHSPSRGMHVSRAPKWLLGLKRALLGGVGIGPPRAWR